MRVVWFEWFVNDRKKDDVRRNGAIVVSRDEWTWDGCLHETTRLKAYDDDNDDLKLENFDERRTCLRIDLTNLWEGVKSFFSLTHVGVRKGFSSVDLKNWFFFLCCWGEREREMAIEFLSPPHLIIKIFFCEYPSAAHTETETEESPACHSLIRFPPPTHYF